MGRTLPGRSSSASDIHGVLRETHTDFIESDRSEGEAVHTDVGARGGVPQGAMRVAVEVDVAAVHPWPDAVGIVAAPDALNRAIWKSGTRTWGTSTAGSS